MDMGIITGSRLRFVPKPLIIQTINGAPFSTIQDVVDSSLFLNASLSDFSKVEVEGNISKVYAKKFPASKSVLQSCPISKDIININDTGYGITKLRKNLFYNSSNIKFCNLPYVNHIGAEAFRSITGLVQDLFFPNWNNMNNNATTPLSFRYINCKRIWAPSVDTFQNSGNDDYFRENSYNGTPKVYANKDEYKDQNGNLIYAYQLAQNYGWQVIPVMNFTKPEAPNAITINNITANSFDISFSAVSHVNIIDEYKVFCRKDNDYFSEFLLQKESPLTSFTVNNLDSNTTYYVEIQTIDEYGNLSERNRDNEIQITTL